MVREAEKKFSNVVFIKIDASSPDAQAVYDEVYSRYKKQSEYVPYLLYFDTKGNLTGETVGYIPAEELEANIQKTLK
ncbi:thioredoxin domain-containing protein [Carboxydothermus ferrireducens]|uniref:Thioredoxin-related protein n=1 Tax=Carboxydothermus ferrireducens DSM 11255 TaxID=1119529 RepID=A0ABX2R8C3_9THEO|nr:hypothetical protein [Carboxydothermus ferrireducens]NYE57155.1 thioredoxin-related protein [Carboxydothermus ferrireducens DSM 11255]